MIIYGKNAVKEAILAKRSLHHVWIDQNFKDQSFLYFLKDHAVRYEQVSKEKLNKLSSDGIHQGVCANVDDYQFKTLDEVINKEKQQRFIVLDELTDPHNLGAIIRSAEATKIDGIILSKKNQVQITPVVVKTSSGGIEHVHLILVGNINQAINKLKENDILVIGADGNTHQLISEVPKNVSIAFVLGSEGVGLRELVKKSCDMLVKIPMYGKVNSLNVSVAAAVIMYLSLEM